MSYLRITSTDSGRGPIFARLPGRGSDHFTLGGVALERDLLGNIQKFEHIRNQRKKLRM